MHIDVEELPRSAVAHRFERDADLGSSNSEIAELGGECSSMDPLHAVEVGYAFGVEPFVGAEADLAGNSADGSGDRGDHDAGQYGHGLGAGDDQDWSAG